MSYSSLFIPHGGGPLPLIDHAPHRSLTEFLKQIPAELIQPSAIVVVTAHWETEPIEVATATKPTMLYDYYGFPPETYELSYPAEGAPVLGRHVIEALNSQAIAAVENEQRGFDHGTFVPLLLMYPKADIPVLQLSLNADLSADTHLNYGKALGQALPADTLVVGSGLSFHNLKSLMGSMSNSVTASRESIEFDDWLTDSVTQPAAQVQDSLRNWATAPHARYCHPREEHLLPLHVIAGVAAARGQTLTSVYSDVLMGHRVSAFAG